MTRTLILATTLVLIEPRYRLTPHTENTTFLRASLAERVGP